jgi:hypothetical protein
MQFLPRTALWDGCDLSGSSPSPAAIELPKSFHPAFSVSKPHPAPKPLTYLDSKIYRHGAIPKKVSSGAPLFMLPDALKPPMEPVFPIQASKPAYIASPNPGCALPGSK